MRIFRIGLLLLTLAPLPAFGQSCGGFTDVPPSNIFCNNIEWIKNRGVTTGCGGTLYCPDGFVPREQMAAFMSRLGTALTPLILRSTQADVDGFYDPFVVGCVSAAVPVTGYPRQASMIGTLWNYNASALKHVQARIAYSTSGPAGPWLFMPDFVMAHNLQIGQHSTLTVLGGPLDLNVGTTYHFAIHAITLNPTATVEGECQLNVRIENRLGAASPFDPIQ